MLGYEPRRHDASELLLDADRWADRVHLGQGERQLAFNEVLDAVDTVAAGFAAAGLAAGDCLLWSPTPGDVRSFPARIDPRQIVDVETVRRRVDGPRVACGPPPTDAGPEREDRPAVIVFTAGTTIPPSSPQPSWGCPTPNSGSGWER